VGGLYAFEVLPPGEDAAAAKDPAKAAAKDPEKADKAAAKDPEKADEAAAAAKEADKAAAAANEADKAAAAAKEAEKAAAAATIAAAKSAFSEFVGAMTKYTTTYEEWKEATKIKKVIDSNREFSKLTGALAQWKNSTGQVEGFSPEDVYLEKYTKQKEIIGQAKADVTQSVRKVSDAMDLAEKSVGVQPTIEAKKAVSETTGAALKLIESYEVYIESFGDELYNSNMCVQLTDLLPFFGITRYPDDKRKWCVAKVFSAEIKAGAQVILEDWLQKYNGYKTSASTKLAAVVLAPEGSILQSGTYSVRLKYNSKYCGVMGNETLACKNSSPGYFKLELQKDGTYSIQSDSNAKYCVVTGTGTLACKNSGPDTWGYFQLEFQKDGTYSLRSKYNNKYCVVTEDGTMSCNKSVPDTYGYFDILPRKN